MGEHGGLGDHADFVAEGGEGIDVGAVLDDVAVAFGVALEADDFGVFGVAEDDG